MNCLQMIAEWRKGCSCAVAGKPEECAECSKALIDALERRLLDVEDAIHVTLYRGKRVEGD